MLDIIKVLINEPNLAAWKVTTRGSSENMPSLLSLVFTKLPF